MNKLISLYLFPLLLLSGLLFSTSSANDIPLPVTDELLRSLGLDREYHKCISVADGDTLTLEGLGAVRLIGVDTPEKNHPKLPVQFLSKEAGAFTEKICLGKKIRLNYDLYDKDKRGDYQRVLGYVYLEDGTFLQEELIKNGYAIAYTKYPMDERKKAQFLAWEEGAKNAVEKASQTLKDLRIAEVTQLDMKIEGGKVVSYRSRIKVSFKYLGS